MFPKRRNDIDATFANSPMKFIGNKRKNGWKYSFKYSLIPACRIAWYCTYKKPQIPHARAVFKSLVGSSTKGRDPTRLQKNINIKSDAIKEKYE